MKGRKPFHATLGLLVLAAILSSCGQAKLGGGIAGTSMVVGPISGFGSILVRGIEFDTSGATVTFEGTPGDASDLRLGMVVRILGVVDPGGRTGVAESITVESLLEAPIESIDVVGRTIVALGQTVRIEDDAVFDPTPLDGLRVGDFVEVSGFFDAAGLVRATRVASPRGDPEYEIQGPIDDLDRSRRRFRIGRVRIDYGAAFFEGLVEDDLEMGRLVEVEAMAPPVDGILFATEVEAVDRSPLVGPGDAVGFEGFVTIGLEDDVFVLNGTQVVRLTGATRFENGSRDDLAPDARVEVEGRLAPDGAIEASEVEFAGARGSGST